MELYAKTELEQYHPQPVLGSSGKFMVLRYGWYSYAFLRTEPADHAMPYALAKATQMVDAIRALADD